MSEAPAAASPPPGLRERKKAKTRAMIQHEALRLFSKQGYEATTVEQIAEAAEVSPSTFFRYFPNKEDVVLTDEYDPVIFAALEAQPPEVGPVPALRAAIASVFSSLSPSEMTDMLQRTELLISVPELRSSFLGAMSDQLRMTAAMIAPRAGRDPDDFAVRAFAGALFGVVMAAMFQWLEDREKQDLLTLFDRALAQLEAGLPLDKPSA